MKIILVIGGAGYIGSQTCKALLLAGYKPVVYDNMVYGHSWAVKWGPLEEGDINDRKRLDAVIRKYQPEAIIHFAAFAYVGESLKHPDKYYRNNVSGSLTLFEAMRDHNIGRIVFSSSCSTYGVPMTIPITEDHPQRPISPYGSSKLMVERILRDFDSAYGMRHISLRYFNAAGADLDGEIGESHSPETHLIPLVLDVALGKRENVSIFGVDYDTYDGSCVRDYIHVEDLAQAHVLALQFLVTKKKSEAINLGTGKGYSVMDVIRKAEEVTGQKISVIICDRREGDPAELVAASNKALQLLKWMPVYSNLRTIIETAWNWHKKMKY